MLNFIVAVAVLGGGTISGAVWLLTYRILRPRYSRLTWAALRVAQGKPIIAATPRARQQQARMLSCWMVRRQLRRTFPGGGYAGTLARRSLARSINRGLWR